MGFDWFDAATLRGIFSVEVGLFTNAALLVILIVRCWSGVPAVMAQWVAYRQQKAIEREAREQALADAKEADWKRLRDEVRYLRDTLHEEQDRNKEFHREQLAENEACRRELQSVREELGEAKAEIARLDAINLGMGKLRQAASSAAAEVRLDDAARRKAEKRGGSND